MKAQRGAAATKEQSYFHHRDAEFAEFGAVLD
jgi:hypothetical protein